MREILFRGKRVDNGEWVYGVPYADYMICGMTTAYYDDEVPISKYSEFDYIEVNPETVGQYTGLTDRNGKKVFEGDVICYRGEENTEVIYQLCEYALIFKSQKCPQCGLLTEYNRNNLEVIGNIHDNPELLKGGEENE